MGGGVRVVPLRRVPARFYAVFMSVNPVFAALTGLVVLGKSLAWFQNEPSGGPN